MRPGARSYVTTQVQSSSPTELVVLLYDTMLQRLAAGRDAMARNDIRARRDALSKTMAILSELQSVLDLERGGSIAAELDRLYTWALSRITDAISQQKVGPLDEVKRVFHPIADAWREIAGARAGAPR